MELTPSNEPQDDVSEESTSQAPAPVVAPTPPPAPIASTEVEPTTQSGQQPAFPAFDETPASPSTASMPSPTPPRKSRKKWVIGSIVAVIAVLLIGGGASAYFLWYQKPEKVVMDAAMGYLEASHIQTTTVITSDSELAPGSGTNVKLKQISFGTKTTSMVNGEFDASVVVSLNGRDYATGGKAMVVDSGDIYFQINGIKELIQKVIQDYAGTSGFTLSSQAQAGLDKLQNKWVKVTKSDLGEAGNSYECFVNTYKKYENDNKVKQELYDAYKAHPFVTVKDSAGSKGDNLGYHVTFDKDVAKQFGDAVDNTTVGKELKKCDSSSNSDTSSSSVDTPNSSSSGTNATITVWVSRWTHTLKGIDYSIDTKNPSNDQKVSFTGHTDVSYDKAVSVTAPSDSESLSKWMQDAQSFYEELSSGASLGLSGSATTASAQVNAMTITKKAEAYNAIMGTYPTLAQLQNPGQQAIDAQLDSSLLSVISSTAPSASSPDTVQYTLCSSNGGKVTYFDTTKQAPVSQSFGSGCSGV